MSNPSPFALSMVVACDICAALDNWGLNAAHSAGKALGPKPAGPVKKRKNRKLRRGKAADEAKLKKQRHNHERLREDAGVQDTAQVGWTMVLEGAITLQLPHQGQGLGVEHDESSKQMN